MQSISHRTPEYNAHAEQLDRKAAEAGQILADAADGAALYNALSFKWFEQGFTAAQLHIDPAAVSFWTEHHAAGYRAALAGYQLQLFDAAAPAVYR